MLGDEAGTWIEPDFVRRRACPAWLGLRTQAQWRTSLLDSALVAPPSERSQRKLSGSRKRRLNCHARGAQRGKVASLAPQVDSGDPSRDKDDREEEHSRPGKKFARRSRPANFLLAAVKPAERTFLLAIWSHIRTACRRARSAR